jgi:hypothetical protein
VIDAMTLALALAVGLILLGLLTGGLQVRGLRRLAERKHVPSDEYAYLRSRYRRRLLTGVVLVAIGGLIGGAYLSGLERQADALGEPREVAENAPKPPMSDEQKQLVRVWVAYWAGVLVLVFMLMGLAVLDSLASRRYWLEQYRQLREDHQTKLRRDLAVHRQQWEQARAERLGNRLGDGDPEPNS